jgi:membrane protease YdiL (CAAX protease family)
MVLLASFVVAELAAAFVSVPLGAAIHAGVVLVALNRYMLSSSDQPEPLWPVVALLSAARLVAMALPVATTSLAGRAAVVGAPAVIGALLLMRHVSDGDADAPGLRRRRVRALVTVAAVGLPLGALAAAAQHLRLPAFSDPVLGYPVAALCLGLFSAAAEELGFRRLLVPAARQSFGTSGAWLASTVLFAATYLASRSVAVVVLALAAGLLFTWAYERTRSIAVPVLGHAIATIGAFLVWPAVIR